MNQGILIAIEGTDGSGKATQTKLLKERLVNEGYGVADFTFPRYPEESSYFVRQYLAGKYGKSDQVNPYTSTLFYALDRYEAAHEIRQALAEGKVVLTDRYAGSNMAHQGTKFPNAEERRGFFIWNDNLEFSLLNIPRPDASFVLHVPAEVAEKLVNTRSKDDSGRTLDIHEADSSHIQKSVEVYDDLCSLFPADFKRIDCVRSGALLGIDEIHALLWNKVSALLPDPIKPEESENSEAAIEPKKGAQQESYLAALRHRTHDRQLKIIAPETPAFFTPPQLLPATKKQYQETITSILQMHSEIATRLTKFADKNNTNQSAQSEAIAEYCLPAAALCEINITAPHSYEVQPTTTQARAIQKQINELLPAFYAGEPASLSLQQTLPRNELDLATSIAYAQSDLPLTAIENESAHWSYEQKARLLESGLAADIPLENTYTFDLTCSLHALLQLSYQELSWQALTPRNGYDVPQLIEDTGLTDLYERCFDTSLELHSMLQAEGYSAESQYGTLLGHKVRALITFSMNDIVELTKHTDSEISALANTVTTVISERHPIVGAFLQNNLDKPA